MTILDAWLLRCDHVEQSMQVGYVKCVRYFFSRKLDRAILKLFMCRQSESFESRGYRIVKIGYMHDNTYIDYFR